MGGIGVPELLIVLAILLLIFGPKRLPTLGKQLGGGMREFKDSITGKSTDDDDEDEDPNAGARAALPEPAAPAVPAPESTPAASDPAAPPRP